MIVYNAKVCEPQSIHRMWSKHARRVPLLLACYCKEIAYILPVLLELNITGSTLSYFVLLLLHVLVSSDYVHFARRRTIDSCQKVIAHLLAFLLLIY